MSNSNRVNEGDPRPYDLSRSLASDAASSRLSCYPRKTEPYSAVQTAYRSFASVRKSAPSAMRSGRER